MLKESKLQQNVKLLDLEPFEDTFGNKKKRKRPKLAECSYAELVSNAEKRQQEYKPEADRDLQKQRLEEWRALVSDKRMEAGQSKRIWDELYKVLDSSDVVVQVLDARDPEGTRTRHVEEYLEKHAPNKSLVFVLNKCDLIPPTVTQKWLKILGRERPTLAFKASMSNPFGKASLI